VRAKPRDGRTIAIERLYAERYQAFRRMALAISGNPEAAHEAVQEGFALALASRNRLRDDDALFPWVWRIVLRVAIDARRREQQQPVLTQVASDALESVPWGLALPRPESDPELAAAVRALSPRRRLVVFLRFFADLSHAEIAEVTGMQLGTVSATLAQAKHALATQLRAEGMPKTKETER
jgi:RNA polymerase sigma factor (sigma-70 family)